MNTNNGKKYLGVAMVLICAPCARAGRIVVEMPDGQTPASAAIADNADNSVREAEINGSKVTFNDLHTETTYTARIELKDGTILQGVDLSWNSEEPERKDAPPLSNDDKKEIIAQTAEIKSFYSSTEILQLKGNHDRAVAVMRLIRDGGFYNDKGGEIIWRIEVWYFKFHYGGWAKVQQANKVLRRERFPDKNTFDQETAHLKFVPELGGMRIDTDGTEQIIKLREDAGKEKPPVVEEAESDE